jgi:predicted RNase H-like HicB family nuclease
MSIIKEARKVYEEDINKGMSVVLTLKDGDAFVAWAPIVDEMATADTEAEAQASLRDAVRLRLEDPNLSFPTDIKIAGVTYSGVFRVEPAGIHNEITSKVVS